VKNDQNIKT